MNRNRVLGTLALLVAALLWGTTFAAQKSVADAALGPFAFNAIRCLLGSLILAPLAVLLSRRGKNTAQDYAPASRQWLYGAVCGVLVFVAISFQQVGLDDTSAGKSGFVTALYVVFVPLLGWAVFRRKTGWNAWLAVLLAAVGLYLLCIKADFTLGQGDLLTLLCAVAFSFQILAVDRYSRQMSGVALSCLQFLVAGALSAVCALLFEHNDLASVTAMWGQLLYSGILSCGVAYTLQIVGQKHTDPTVASLLMSLEAVFAALSGWLVLHEQLSVKEMIGCVVMFAAIVFAQLPLSNRAKKEECTA